jgi:hypothetical protein
MDEISLNEVKIFEVKLSKQGLSGRQTSIMPFIKRSP